MAGSPVSWERFCHLSSDAHLWRVMFYSSRSGHDDPATPQIHEAARKQRNA
jgi:hypothetical protein